jgi:hypothetical protein
LNSNPGRFVCFTSIFVHLEKRFCLSCGVQVAGATWRAAMRIVVGVGDLVQRIRDGRTSWVLGGRTIERSGDVMCGLHRARGDDGRVFLVEPQNQGGGGFPGLGLKTGRYSLVIWDSKSP